MYNELMALYINLIESAPAAHVGPIPLGIFGTKELAAEAGRRWIAAVGMGNETATVLALASDSALGYHVNDEYALDLYMAALGA